MGLKKVRWEFSREGNALRETLKSVRQQPATCSGLERDIVWEDWSVKLTDQYIPSSISEMYITAKDCCNEPAAAGQDERFGFKLTVTGYASLRDSQESEQTISLLNKVEPFWEGNYRNAGDRLPVTLDDPSAYRYEDRLGGIQFDIIRIAEPIDEHHVTTYYLSDERWEDIIDKRRVFVYPYSILQELDAVLPATLSEVAQSMGLGDMPGSYLIWNEKLDKLVSLFEYTGTFLPLHMREIPRLHSVVQRYNDNISLHPTKLRDGLTKQDIDFLGEMRAAFLEHLKDFPTAVSVYLSRFFLEFALELEARQIVGRCPVCNGYFWHRRAKKACSPATDDRKCKKIADNARFYRQKADRIRPLARERMRKFRDEYGW